MHSGNSRLDLGLHQPLQFFAKEIFHGDFVGLHLLEVFEQSAVKEGKELFAQKHCMTLQHEKAGFSLALNPAGDISMVSTLNN